jgi:ubiquinone biosynthesis protein UbiJ
MEANIREYLQEEGRDAPSRYEVDAFSSNVSTLRDDVDRVEARLNRLLKDR